MDKHYFILVTLIVFGGLLGGLVNYYRKDNKKFIVSRLLKSLLFGICAAFLIPIFFQIVPSDLFNTNIVNTGHYFIIFGFCIVAGIFSTNFMDSLGKKVLNLQDDLSKTNQELENLLTEDDIEFYKNFDFIITNEEFELLKCIDDNKFKYRAISKIAIELRQDREIVRERLESLRQKKLVELVDRPTGKKWKITGDGKDYIDFFYREVDEESSCSLDVK